MKRFITLVFGILIAAIVANAQSPITSITDKVGNPVILSTDTNMYDWRPFDNKMGITVYGSGYRKALNKKKWGQVLSLGATPFLLLSAAALEGQDLEGLEIIDLCLAAGSLAAGIPLWIIGQKKLDKFIDDYSRRYAPGPRVSVGATGSGLGLALNF